MRLEGSLENYILTWQNKSLRPDADPLKNIRMGNLNTYRTSILLTLIFLSPGGEVEGEQWGETEGTEASVGLDLKKALQGSRKVLNMLLNMVGFALADKNVWSY